MLHRIRAIRSMVGTPNASMQWRWMRCPGPLTHAALDSIDHCLCGKVEPQTHKSKLGGCRWSHLGRRVVRPDTSAARERLLNPVPSHCRCKSSPTSWPVAGAIKATMPVPSVSLPVIKMYMAFQFIYSTTSIYCLEFILRVPLGTITKKLKRRRELFALWMLVQQTFLCYI